MIARISNAVNDITDLVQANVGKVIEIEGGLDYVFSKPFTNPATARTEIHGEGEYHTRIRAQDGACHNLGLLKIRDLSIWRADQPRAPGDWGEPTFGVFAEGRVSLSEMSIDGYTIGVRVWADGSDRGTHANRCYFEHLTINGSGLQGVQFRGRDANACVLVGVAVYSAGEHGRFFVARDARLIDEAIASGAPLPTDLLGLPCGIYDHSFLGNASLGRLVSSSHEDMPSIDANGDPTVDGYGRRILDANGDPIRGPDGKAISVRVGYAPVIFDGNSQHATDLGPYHESDQGAAQYDQGTTSIGGCATAWESSNKTHAQHGMRLDGAACSALDIHNDLDPNNKTTVRLGRNAGSGSFFALCSDRIDAARPLRAKAIPPALARGGTPAIPGGYGFDIANQPSGGIIRQDGKAYIYRGGILTPL